MAVPLGLAVAGVLFFAAWLLAGSPKELEVASDWAYDGAVAMAGIACLARAFLSPAVCWAWLAFAVGLIGWAAGDVYWTQELSELRRVPYPS